MGFERPMGHAQALRLDRKGGEEPFEGHQGQICLPERARERWLVGAGRAQAFPPDAGLCVSGWRPPLAPAASTP